MACCGSDLNAYRSQNNNNFTWDVEEEECFFENSSVSIQGIAQNVLAPSGHSSSEDTLLDYYSATSPLSQSYGKRKRGDDFCVTSSTCDLSRCLSDRAIPSVYPEDNGIDLLTLRKK